LKKSLKISLFIVGGLVLLFLIIKFGSEWYISEKLTDKINQDNKMFQVDVEDVEVDLFNQIVTFTSIKFQPVDSSSSSVEGNVDRIELGSFDITGFLFNGVIKTNQIDINAPELTYVARKASKTKKQDSTSGGLFKQDIFDRIKVKKLTIDNGNLKLAGTLKGSYKLDRFSLENIVVDSASMAKKIPFNYDSALMRVDSISYQPDSLYRLASSQITYDAHQLSIQDFQLIPLVDQSQYVETFAKRKPLYDIFTSSILIDSLYWEMPVGEKVSFTTAQLNLDSLNLALFIDKRVPANQQKVPMPSQSLQKLPFLMTINAINVNNSILNYSIRPEDNPEVAELVFSDISIDGDHITNDSSLLANQPSANFEINAVFMKKSKFKGSFSFNMVKNDYPFTASGNLAPFLMHQVNSLTRPLLSVELNGSLNNLTYDFSGNSDTASGSVDLAYQDLKITFQEKPNKSAPILQALSELVVNNNVKQANNQVAKVDFDKDPTKGFFDYWWTGLESGIKKTLLP